MYLPWLHDGFYQVTRSKFCADCERAPAYTSRALKIANISSLVHSVVLTRAVFVNCYFFPTDYLTYIKVFSGLDANVQSMFI